MSTAERLILAWLVLNAIAYCAFELGLLRWLFGTGRRSFETHPLR